MYKIKNGQKESIVVSHKDDVMEGYKVDWKSYKTWLMIGGAVALLILLIFIIYHLFSKKH